MVDLETTEIFTTPILADAYRLSQALYDVGIPSYLVNAEGDDLPSADDGGPPAHPGSAPYTLSIYPQDEPLAVDIIAETFQG